MSQEHAGPLPVDIKLRQKARLLSWLKKRSDNWQQALERYELTVTVNKQFVEWDTPVEEGDEVAIVRKG